MKKSIILSILLSATLTTSALACTDFRTTAKDGTVIIARSMEFATDMKSNLRSVSKNKAFTNTTPNGKPGFSWTSKYGYVYLDGLGIDTALDGMNDQGLSFEYLLFPNEAQYQTIPTGQESQALSYIQFGQWILGSFKTVDEVKEALPKMLVFAERTQSSLGNAILPAHAAIYDASGKGLIVEYVGGTLNMYDSIGVMTNSPAYNWHTTNLRNYLNLTPNNPKPIVTQVMTFAATGQGAGMVGLPGDFSPPSRFVKTAILSQTAFPAPNAASALNLAEHIINNVDIPAGTVREGQTGNPATDYTQWAVFKDLKNKIFYFRTYNNLALRAVSLDKIDFSEGVPGLKMPIATNPQIQDVTDQFVKG